MSYISVDIESDGQSPATGSMVCFGAVLVKDTTKTFYRELKTITDQWDPDALAISGFSREEQMGFGDPKKAMEDFAEWLYEVSEGKPTFITDNPAFDWQWINYYFHKYLGKNPFGFSARRIGDLYCGLVKDASKNSDWKRKYRKTVHDHNPVNDAKGNAEALIAIQDLGLKIKF